MLTLIGAVLLFLSAWILIAAPVDWLYPLSVGAPEVSPLLLGLAALVFLLTLRKLGSRKLAAVIALAAAGLSAIPISKVSAVEREFDRELTRVFPSETRRAVPRNARAKPFIVRDMFKGLSGGEVRVLRGLQYSAPDTRSLVLDVYRPPSPGLYPAMVQIHGGAWQRGSRIDDETFARYFAGRGYVVFAIDYRFAPQSKWPKALEDVRAALDWVRSNAASYEADPSRLALIGRSAGAQLALIAGYTYGAHAVVSYYGPTDLDKGWRNPPDPDPMKVRSILETYLGGTPGDMRERYVEASPITYATAVSPPTLILHGSRDHVVRPEFAREFQKKLKDLGSKSMLIELPWAEHAFDVLPNSLSGQVSLYCTERFLAAALARPQ